MLSVTVLPDAFSVIHDRPLESEVSVLDNDTTDAGGALVVSAVNGDSTSVGQAITLPSGASLFMNANGSFFYAPLFGSAYLEAFEYTATDGIDAANAEVSIAITNNAPAAISDSYSISHHLTLDTVSSYRDSVLANDQDADADTLTAHLVTAPYIGPFDAVIALDEDGSFQLNEDGFFVLTPPGGFIGQISFSYRAFDGVAYSLPATFTIEVSNAGPSDIHLSNSVVNIYDTEVGTFTAEDTDYLETFSYSLLDAASYADNALFAIEGDVLRRAESASFAPGTYTLGVEATDGAGASIERTFTITVENVAVWIDSIQDAIKGESTGYFRLCRSESSGDLTVPYTIDSERTTAEAGVDYAPLSGSVTFALGQEYADITVDPTGIYSIAPNPDSKSLAIQLVDMPGGVGIAPGANQPLFVFATAFPDPPTFTEDMYTFAVGYGADKGIDVGQVIANGQAGEVRYTLVGGNGRSYLTINREGWIQVSQRIPLDLLGQQVLSLIVRATDRAGGTRTVGVIIGLVPLILITGDLEGVAAPIGALRDTINLTFIRIDRAPRPAMTISYNVTWEGGTSAENLANGVNLLNGFGNSGSVTFGAGVERVRVSLTPRVVADQSQLLQRGFQVTLRNPGSGIAQYSINNWNSRMDLGPYLPTYWGQKQVTVTILPSVTVFGADNLEADLVDPAPAGGGANLGIDRYDIQQGNVGDCSLLAALGAMALRSPADIQSLFIPAANGSLIGADGFVSVKIFTNPGSQPAQFTTVRIAATLTRGLSQARLTGDYKDNAGGGVRSFEIWVQLVEKAYVRYLTSTNQATWESFWNDGVDPVEVLPRLTNRPAQDTRVSSLTSAQAQDALIAAVAAGQKVVLSTNATVEYSFWDNAWVDLFGGHAYSVEDIWWDFGLLELFNPHGRRMFIELHRVKEFSAWYTIQ